VFNEIFAFPDPALVGPWSFGCSSIQSGGKPGPKFPITGGGLLLMLALLFWVAIVDFYRVARVRRMLTAVLRQDVTKLRKVADAGLRARANGCAKSPGARRTSP